MDLTLSSDPLITKADLAGRDRRLQPRITPAGGTTRPRSSRTPERHLGDAENNIQTTGNTNICDTGVATTAARSP